MPARKEPRQEVIDWIQEMIEQHEAEADMHNCMAEEFRYELEHYKATGRLHKEVRRLFNKEQRGREQ